jgi:hypothetical protein
MILPVLGEVGETFREFFLLAQAERKSTTLSASQLDGVRAYEDAARRRLSAAQGLRDPTELRVALSLYRSAALLQIAAFLLSRDHSLEVERLTPEDMLERLSRALDGDDGDVSNASEIESLRNVVTASDPFAIERFPTETARGAVDGLESATRWLATLVESRSPARLRWVRRIRLAAAAIAALALTVWFARWALSPPNVALHKPARSSSIDFDTQASGAVDGELNGRFGFHSQLEDSPWLSIDLERPCLLKTVEIYGRGDCCYDQSIPLVLEVSDDDRSYRPIAERTTPFNENDPWVVKPPGERARFVRLRADHHGLLVLGEVVVHGDWANELN